jgi:hypothetical protein
LGAKKLLNHSSLIALAIVVAINVAAAGVACHAGGQFDGQWVGTGPEAGDCGVLTVTLTIVDDRITGTVVGRHGTGYIGGATVSPDATAAVAYGGTGRGSIRFSGNTFAGTFGSFCGRRNVTGARATRGKDG